MKQKVNKNGLDFLRKRRYKAMKLFEKEERSTVIAKKLKVRRQTVNRWRRDWIAGGKSKESLKGA